MLKKAKADSDPASGSQTRDVAEAVLFLTSERASGLTGVDLNVNAGVVMY